MNKRNITVAAVMGLLVALSAADLFAAGRGPATSGAAGGQQIRTSSTTTRPAGSQRRDGTFLTTGVTANGSTTRPGNGNGLQDGSRLTGTTTTPSTQAQ